MYIYYNPFTDTVAKVKDFDHKIAEYLLENKEKHFLMVYSSFSNTIKIQKYHFSENVCDDETIDTILEIKRPFKTLNLLLTFEQIIQQYETDN